MVNSHSFVVEYQSINCTKVLSCVFNREEDAETARLELLAYGDISEEELVIVEVCLCCGRDFEECLFIS